MVVIFDNWEIEGHEAKVYLKGEVVDTIDLDSLVTEFINEMQEKGHYKSASG